MKGGVAMRRRCACLALSVAILGGAFVVSTRAQGVQDPQACPELAALNDPMVRAALLDEPMTRAEALRVLYVDRSAAGADTGLTWADAWTSLQVALAEARAGDQIWIAAGVYRPDEGPGGVPGDREASFEIPDGVVLYGGFPRGGGAWDTRDPRGGVTILSGDLQGNDRPGFWFHADNSYHVLRLTDAGPGTILNGLVIAGGHANGAEAADRHGGAALVRRGTPRFQRCVFRTSLAETGGALYLDQAQPLLADCRFEGNFARQRGGALANVGGSRPTLAVCRFTDNGACESGGAVENAATPDCPTFLNCIWAANQAGWGGALAGRAGSRPLLWNCVLYGNTARTAGGGVWSASYVTAPLLVNSILWANTDGSGRYWRGQITGGTPDIRYCCVQGWFETRVGVGNTGAAPRFADPEGGDFHLRSLAGRWDPVRAVWIHDGVNSPCLDAGDPDANWLDERWPHGWRVNMGAYGGTPFASLAWQDLRGPGDTNHDFVLDMEDVQALGHQWLTRGGLADQDLDRNGVVNLRDFALLAEQWRWFEEVPWAGRMDLTRVTFPDSTAAFADLTAAVDTRYSYATLRDVNWPTLYAEFGAAVRATPDVQAFANAVAEMLGHAGDPHIHLQVGERMIPSFEPAVTANINPALLPALVPRWLNHNDRVSTGRFDDGIGYVLIKSWSGENTKTMRVVYEALRQWQDAPGVILDVRLSGDGSEPLAAEVAGSFVLEPRLYATHRDRDPGQTDGFSPVRERWIAPSPAQPAYHGPVAVLMGPRCMGVCESFLRMMQQVEGAVLVGTRSYGSSGRPRPTVLSNGVRVYLPSWWDMHADGTVLEGRGVAPDLLVEAGPAAFQDADPVLARALTRLREP